MCKSTQSSFTFLTLTLPQLFQILFYIKRKFKSRVPFFLLLLLFCDHNAVVKNVYAFIWYKKSTLDVSLKPPGQRNTGTFHKHDICLFSKTTKWKHRSLDLCAPGWNTEKSTDIHCFVHWIVSTKLKLRLTKKQRIFFTKV